MARDKPSWIVAVEYWPVRALFAALARLPRRMAERLAHGAIRAVLLCVPKRRRLVVAQIAAAFPERSKDEHQALARQSIAQLASAVAVFPRIPDLVRDERGLVTTEGEEHFHRALAQGRGLIAFTAHYGCWEWMAISTSRRFPRVAMVARPLDNPRIDALVKSVRESAGGRVISRREALKEGIRWVRANGVLGVLIDQNLHKGGIFVDFFGRPAATTTVVSLLARRTGCAVIPVHNTYRDGHLHVVYSPPMALSAHPDPEQAVAEDTQAFTKVVEEWIRQDPTQWLWLHNRWKRQPQDEDEAANAPRR